MAKYLHHNINSVNFENPRPWLKPSELKGFEEGNPYFLFQSSHKPMWNLFAEHMIKHVKSVIPSGIIVDAEHIGSTSIPNVTARSGIAINFAVTKLSDARAYLDYFREEGWALVIDNNEVISLTSPPMGICVGNQKPSITTIPDPAYIPVFQIYFLTKLQRQWHMKKAFRDYLTAHPEDAKEYAKLKSRLAEEFRHDLDSYRKGKTAFVVSILKKCGYDMFYVLDKVDKDTESFIGGNLPPRLPSFHGATEKNGFGKIWAMSQYSI